MIKITITSVSVDASFVERHPAFKVGDTAYYVIRDSGKRLSPYHRNEGAALESAWTLIRLYGLTLVEPW